ncbi:MAG: hypothetical protein ACFB50_15585 [Rubrobacteraceae bacterium]
MITVTSRQQPATRDPMELNHRNAQIAVLEWRAQRLFCSYSTWGELGATRVKVVARTPAETGRLFRYLVEADLSHDSSLLYVEVEAEDERQMIRGLGLPELVFQERLH